MSDEMKFRIRLEPVGADRFEISFVNEATGKEKCRLQGPGRIGYTEDDLRDPMGLPKCGLNEVQIDSAIQIANSHRTS